MRSGKGWIKISSVIAGAILVTSLGIDAADTLTGSGGTFFSSLVPTRGAHSCGEGMIMIDNVPGIRCVDAYEASTSDGCPILTPQNAIESHKNTEQNSCTPHSVAKGKPWTYVTRDQAQKLCQRVDKRLPTSAEWYGLAAGMTQVDRVCNLSSREVSGAGEYPSCVTPQGAYDMVGNVWEWTSDDVIDGKYNNHVLPSSGFVTQADSGGVAVMTGDVADELFGQDYFWSNQEGFYGMIRGGFYGSERDGGLYSVHADTQPTAASVGIGFRCVK